MRRIAPALAALVLVAGCAKTPTPTPAPPPVDAPSPPEAPPVVKPPDPAPPPAAEAARKPIAGGFRIGPYRQILNLQWVGNDRVYGVFRSGQAESLGLVSLGAGLVQPLHAVTADRAFYINEPVLDGTAVLFSGLEPGHWLQPAAGQAVKIAEGSQWQVSPDRTRLVSYPKGQAGWYVDLRTGESHQVEAPGFYGSNVWDAWSPDGARYLVQTRRTDPVPGFYLLDQSARRPSTWHEPGYYSLWAQWAPDSRHIAFLSVPLETVYPKHPEAWAEPRLAPRLGVLDLVSGKARYFALEQQVLGGEPLLWSPDSTKVATLCGDLQTEGETAATMVGQRICIADLSTGTMTAVTTAVAKPDTPDQRRLLLDSWSPDGQRLVYGVHANPSAPAEYHLIPTTGSDEPVPLPGRVTWISSELFAAVGGTVPRTLSLHDRQGKHLRELARGVDITWVSLSPDKSHLTYAVNLNTTHASDPPSTYLVVIDAQR